MPTIDELISAFDLLVHGVDLGSRPTAASVRVINERLGVKLPDALVEFCSRSQHAGTWFAGLGEDYLDPCHILRVNHRAGRIRRRAAGRWRYVKPAGFVIINLGYDRDFDGFDTTAFDAARGEYPIHHWSPPNNEGDVRYPGFVAYVEGMIRGWADQARPELRSRALEIIGPPRADAPPSSGS